MIKYIIDRWVRKKKTIFILLFLLITLILTGCNKKSNDTKNEFGSYLELKEDNTFIDAIVPITDGSKSNTGKYTIKRDYFKIGDAYIFLSYQDGNEVKLQRVKLDDSDESYLVLDNIINDYQLYLKK